MELPSLIGPIAAHKHRAETALFWSFFLWFLMFWISRVHYLSLFLPFFFSFSSRLLHSLFSGYQLFKQDYTHQLKIIVYKLKLSRRLLVLKPPFNCKFQKHPSYWNSAFDWTGKKLVHVCKAVSNSLAEISLLAVLQINYQLWHEWS